MYPIHLRQFPPPSETTDYTSLILMFANWIKPEKYVQIGLGDGSIFQSVATHCKEALAVDLNSPAFSLPSNATYYSMDSEKFYNSYKDAFVFDMVFVNSGNDHEQTYKEFDYFKDLVAVDGVILFKHTYPFDPNYCTPENYGDCYKTPIKIKKEHSQEWEVLTLPFNPGFTICKKVMAGKSLAWL